MHANRYRVKHVVGLFIVFFGLTSFARGQLAAEGPNVPRLGVAGRSPTELSLQRWTYIHADDSRGKWGDTDEPKWLRYFGLAISDLTGDGKKDIGDLDILTALSWEDPPIQLYRNLVR